MEMEDTKSSAPESETKVSAWDSPIRRPNTPPLLESEALSPTDWPSLIPLDELKPTGETPKEEPKTETKDTPEQTSWDTSPRQRPETGITRPENVRKQSRTSEKPRGGKNTVRPENTTPAKAETKSESRPANKKFQKKQAKNGTPAKTNGKRGKGKAKQQKKQAAQADPPEEDSPKEESSEEEEKDQEREEKIQKEVSFIDNVQKYRATYVKGDEDAKKRLEKAGLTDLRTTKASASRNPHALGASVRAFLTAQALGLLYENGCRHVASLFGGDRDSGIAAFLNKGVPKEHQLKVSVLGHDVVPQDIIRRTNRSKQAKEPIDGYLLVNVYSFDGLPIEPKTLAPLLIRGPVAAIWHPFNGVMKRINETGGWIRLPDDMIQMHASKEDDSAVIHPALDWAHSPGTYNDPYVAFAWTLVRRICDLSLILFKESMATKTSVSHIPSDFKMVEIDMPDLSNGIKRVLYERLPIAAKVHWRHLPFLTSRRGVVDTRLKASLERWINYRNLGRYTLQQLQGLARQHIQSETRYKGLVELFPEQITNVIADTIHAALISHLERNSEKVAFNGSYGAAVEFNNSSLSELGKNQLDELNSTYDTLITVAKTGLIIIGGTVLIGMTVMSLTKLIEPRFRGFMFGGVPANLKDSLEGSVFSAWLLKGCSFVKSTLHEAPARHILLNIFPIAVVEELIKRGHWLLSLGIPLAEILAYSGRWVAESPYTSTLVKYSDVSLKAVIHGAKHVLFTVLPLPFGILTHVLHNVLIYAEQSGVPANVVSAGQVAMTAAAALPPAWKVVGITAGLVALGVTAFLVVRRLRAPSISEWEIFYEAYYDEGTSWTTRPPVSSELLHVEELLLNRNTVKYVTDAPIEDSPPAQHLKQVVKTPFIEIQYETESSIHLFAAFNCPMYAACSSPQNIWAVCQNRLNRASPLTTEEQEEAWSFMKNNRYPGFEFFSQSEIDELQSYDIHPLRRRFGDEQGMTLIAKWGESFKGTRKYARNSENARRMQDDPPDRNYRGFRKVQGIVKTREWLYRRNEDSTPAFRPRAIHNVDGGAAAWLGSAVTEAMDRFKAKYNVFADPQWIDTIDGQTWQFHACYGGASTDYELTYWKSRALQGPPGSVWITVAGDDSALIIISQTGKVIAIEADRSLYDGSQLEAPIVHENQVLKDLGVEETVLTDLCTLATAEWALSDRKGFIDIRYKTRVMRRLTGGPKTTFGNSVNTIFTEIHGAMAVIKGGCASPYDDYYRATSSLGFKMKVRVHDDPKLLTFLKGMWFPCALGPDVWTVLPSRVIKAGKSATNPETIFRSVLRDLPKEKRRRKAGELFLGAQAANYDSFLPVPVLRAFVEKYRPRADGFPFRLARGEDTFWKPTSARGLPMAAIHSRVNKLRHYTLEYPISHDLTRMAEQWETHPGGASLWNPHVDVEAAFELAAKHYGVSIGDLTTLEEQIAKAPQFFFICNPTVEKMMRADYG